MRGSDLLNELIAVAQKQRVTVRRESMSRGVTGGGFCVLKGVPTVFLDERSNTDTQIEILASALRRYDWSEVFLPPAIRALVGGTSSDDASS